MWHLVVELDLVYFTGTWRWKVEARSGVFLVRKEYLSPTPFWKPYFFPSRDNLFFSSHCALCLNLFFRFCNYFTLLLFLSFFPSPFTFFFLFLPFSCTFWKCHDNSFNTGLKMLKLSSSMRFKPVTLMPKDVRLSHYVMYSKCTKWLMARKKRIPKCKIKMLKLFKKWAEMLAL